MGGDRRSLISMTLGLMSISAIAKMVLLPCDAVTLGEYARWLLRSAVVMSADLCFIAGMAAVLGLGTWFVGRWPRALTAWRPVVFAIYYGCGLYAVLSVPMYRITLEPFSIHFLAFIGGPGMMASSIGRYIEPMTVTAVVVAPVTLLCLPWLTYRLPWFRAGAPLSLRWTCAALLLVAIYGSICQAYVGSHWTDPNRWERRISQNPHAVLLGSCIQALLADERLAASFSLKEIDQSDFTPARIGPAAREADAAQMESQLSGARPKNIIIVQCESIGAEYLSLYGSKYVTTPKLQKLAQEKGVVFENCYCQAPYSWKGLVALTASTYDHPDWREIVHDTPRFDVPTIQAVLARHGYRNCFLHAGYWNWRRGEQFLRERQAETIIDARHLHGDRANSWGSFDRAMFHRALQWIDGLGGKPFFVFAGTIETHHPYVVSSEAINFGESDEEFERYLNALRTTDDNIAWLMDELARRGLEESTVVVITADHGESFGQHDRRLHSFSPYEQTVHVPLIVLHPSLQKLPRRISDVRQHIDVPPTLLAMLGIPAPPEWQGRNLFRHDEQSRAYFSCVRRQVTLGLREGRFKYHFYVDNGLQELFDIDADPGELHNLAESQAQRCRQYQRRVAGFVTHQRAFLQRHGSE
jgi:arylsulfatase A-like enzyme